MREARAALKKNRAKFALGIEMRRILREDRFPKVPSGAVAAFHLFRGRT